MNLTIISAAIGMAIGYGLSWELQQGNIDRVDKQRLEIALENERLVSRVESARSTQNIAAQNDRAKRESKLRLDADANRAAADSLRSALSTVVQASRDDPTTCPDRTATTAELFVQCGSALGELAAKADQHVSDLKTLIQAWPK